MELNGFKSFASKTILEFPKGITAIVGPNGSGKSNVIDAIRWILGEREAKNLRGGKAEDLIFAGTPKKARVGMAQVGINFDNSAKFFPVEFDEVSVYREISRDGDSKYLLNKSETRAKDIIDFFARSRLGTRGITIINQGSSDLFVKATPQERKAMIEEVLGLKEYQLKKAEAERKLKATILNLEKARIMIEEVAPRLRILKRQVAKYQARDQKQEELKNLENAYFSHKAIEIEKSLKTHDSSIKELERSIGQSSKELENFSAGLTQIENSRRHDPNTDNFKSKERDLSSRRSQLQKEIGRIEARLEFLSAYSDSDKGDDIFKKEEMLSLLKEVKNNLEDSFRNNDFSLIKSLISKIEAFLNKPFAQKSEKSAELAALENSKNNLVFELQTIEKELEEIETKNDETAKGLEDFNERFKTAFEKVEAKKDEIRELESKKKYLLFENESLSSKIRELKNDWLQNNRSEEEFNKLNLQPTTHNPQPSAADTERQMFRLRAELMSIGEIDESLVKEAEEVEKHHNFLTTQSADLEKASTDLKSLIEELKTEIHTRFADAFKSINDEFNKFFRLMFGGGNAKLKLQKPPIDKRQTTSEENEGESASADLRYAEGSGEAEEEKERNLGVEIELNLPRKRINSLDVLSGGEKSLVSIAALFALISVSPPPFLVLDEIDAPLDEKNSKRFADLVKEFCRNVQFIIVTHNRTVMETADVLYGVTMNEDGTSKLISLKLE